MGPSVKYPRASHTNGPDRQPPTPLWPLPRVILGNYKLPGLHPELDILIQVRHTVFIDTPSQPYRSREPGSVKILEGAENLQGGVSRLVHQGPQCNRYRYDTDKSAQGTGKFTPTTQRCRKIHQGKYTPYPNP